MGWRVLNPDSSDVVIESAWLPHGRFRGREVAFAPPLVVARGDGVVFELEVRCPAEPGTVVENGFLILRLSSGERVFARVRVTIGADGRPEVVVESVTSS